MKENLYNQIILSKGPILNIDNISKLNLDESFVTELPNDKLIEIIKKMQTPKRYACVKRKEEIKQERPEIVKPKLADCIKDNNIKILSAKERLNNHFAVFMNKQNDYLLECDNNDINTISNKLNNFIIEKKEEIKPIMPKKLNPQAGYINFTLLVISTSFLTILSVLLGLLILGK